MRKILIHDHTSLKQHGLRDALSEEFSFKCLSVMIYEQFIVFIVELIMMSWQPTLLYNFHKMRVTWFFYHFFKLQVHVLHKLENISIFKVRITAKSARLDKSVERPSKNHLPKNQYNWKTNSSMNMKVGDIIHYYSLFIIHYSLFIIHYSLLILIMLTGYRMSWIRPRW